MVDAISEDADWYVVNIDERGYYRVNYDQENWEALIAKLADTETYTVSLIIIVKIKFKCLILLCTLFSLTNIIPILQKIPLLRNNIIQ